jgi:hypothetical protein
MKAIRKFVTVVAALAFAATITVMAYAADPEYGLIVNGDIAVFETGSEPININNRLLFPLRTVFDAIDDGSGSLDWDEESRMVMISLQEKEVKLWIGNPEAEADGVTVPIPDGVSPIIHNDRTYLPLRFIAEQFDMIVGWNEEHSTASVVDRNVYDAVRALLLEFDSNTTRLSCDMVMIMDTSIFIDTAGVVTEETTRVETVGSYEIDIDNNFARIIMTTTLADETMDLEMYMSGNEMFVSVNGEWLDADSDALAGLGIDASGVMGYLDMANIEGLTAELEAADPYLTLGLSEAANGDDVVTGVLFLPSEAMSDLVGTLLEDFDEVGGFVELDISPILIEYVFCGETNDIKSMNMDFVMTMTMNVEGQPVSMVFTYNVKMDNIDLDPDFESVIPDSVRNRF